MRRSRFILTIAISVYHDPFYNAVCRSIQPGFGTGTEYSTLIFCVMHDFFRIYCGLCFCVTHHFFHRSRSLSFFVGLIGLALGVGVGDDLLGSGGGVPQAGYPAQLRKPDRSSCMEDFAWASAWVTWVIASRVMVSPPFQWFRWAHGAPSS